jgi:hypothetical protein
MKNTYHLEKPSMKKQPSKAWTYQDQRERRRKEGRRKEKGRKEGEWKMCVPNSFEL